VATHQQYFVATQWIAYDRSRARQTRRRIVHCGLYVNGRVIELLPFTAKDAKDSSGQVSRYGL